MKKTKIYFRADGNSEIGLGHVFRSLALADMLKANFESFFLIQAPSSSLIKRIEQISNLIILPQSKDFKYEAMKIANNYLSGNEIVVLDGYMFDTDYQERIKEKGSKLACIDDIHSYRFIADVIINHAGGISTKEYSKSLNTACYLGVEYALLHQPFLKAAKKKVEKIERNEYSIFVCMGGADPNNDTLKVLQFVETKTPAAEIYLILGAAYPHLSRLKTFLSNTLLSVSILNNISADEMVFYMQKCPYAICSPSTVAYEYSSVGGVLFLHQTADNQSRVYQHFIQSKLAYPIQEYPVNTEREILLLSKQFSQFDGASSKRLKKIFLHLEKEMQLSLREANNEDMRLYFNWANEPKTRNSGFHTTPIPIEKHKKWFLTKINNPNTKLFVFENNKQPIGQVRLEKSSEDSCVISFSVDNHHNGMGYGKTMLKQSIQKALEERFCKNFEAYVKHDNIASLKIFERLNFEYRDDTEFNNIPCKSFILVS